MTIGDKIIKAALARLEAGDGAGFYRCLELHWAWSRKVNGKPDTLMRGENAHRHDQLNPQENKHG